MTADECPIKKFDGDYSFLSNFYIEPDGTHVEGEYQSAKCAKPEDAARILGLPPAKAKREGRKALMLPGWDNSSVRVAKMTALVRKKFTDHPALAQLLLATGDRKLAEGNYWNDTFWGVSWAGGENHLGKILMAVRAELKEKA